LSLACSGSPATAAGPASARSTRSGGLTVGGSARRVGASPTAIAACALSQQAGAAAGGLARRSRVAPGTFLATGARVGRTTRGAAIVRGRAAFAAARVVGWADRRIGAAGASRLVCTDASTGATAFASPPQQLPEPSFRMVVCGGAAAGSVREALPGGSETETSTGAVETDTATVPTWTLTETLGMLTRT